MEYVHWTNVNIFSLNWEIDIYFKKYKCLTFLSYQSEVKILGHFGGFIDHCFLNQNILLNWSRMILCEVICLCCLEWVTSCLKDVAILQDKGVKRRKDCKIGWLSLLHILGTPSIWKYLELQKASYTCSEGGILNTCRIAYQLHVASWAWRQSSLATLPTDFLKKYNYSY